MHSGGYGDYGPGSSGDGGGEGKGGVRGHAQELERAIRDREGRPYPAYHDIEGAWAFSESCSFLTAHSPTRTPRRPAAVCRSDDKQCSCRYHASLLA